MKAVYGPVSSWRLGRSLGVDPICSEEKICSFDCVYCQLGIGKKTYRRKDFISLEKLKKDLSEIKKVKADIITFSGTGEPTLAKNLGEMIDYIKTVSDLPLAILTNSSFLSEKDVRQSLHRLDSVVAKLDASNEKIFREINKPHKTINFAKYLEGIRLFRKNYKGKFALQIMLIDINKGFTPEIVELARELNPNEVQINTPLRPCAVNPLSKEELRKIKDAFSGFKNVVSVYEAEKPEVHPISIEEVKKRKRPEP